ncbi:hypothetical protein PoB_001513300 [Plakobranchus ocellatus]|uniref:Uncharacterized protein n=1 Tax=Plakobranchus ocellatus TaxID=259542 RepID=A0AAV3Z292_9GAST|nr:hypothetical protein PoB_001513300 [Plakobranchus ocellatus]
MHSEERMHDGRKTIKCGVGRGAWRENDCHIGEWLRSEERMHDGRKTIKCGVGRGAWRENGCHIGEWMRSEERMHDGRKTIKCGVGKRKILGDCRLSSLTIVLLISGPVVGTKLQGYVTILIVVPWRGATEKFLTRFSVTQILDMQEPERFLDRLCKVYDVARVTIALNFGDRKLMVENPVCGLLNLIEQSIGHITSSRSASKLMSFL